MRVYAMTVDDDTLTIMARYAESNRFTVRKQYRDDEMLEHGAWYEIQIRRVSNPENGDGRGLASLIEKCEKEAESES